MRVAAAAFAVVVEREIVFRIMRGAHDSWLLSGASAMRSFFTARNTLCLAALVPRFERRADFVDRSSFVVPQRERGALERAQLAERRLHPPLDLGALRHPLRSRHVRRRQLHAPRRGCRRAPGRAAPASTASDPPSSWRRCDTARCRSSPATRTVRAADRREESFPGPHLRHPVRCRSSGRPAGRHSGCAARRARGTPRCRPGGHGPGRLLPRSRPSV